MCIYCLILCISCVIFLTNLTIIIFTYLKGGFRPGGARPGGGLRPGAAAPAAAASDSSAENVNTANGGDSSRKPLIYSKQMLLSLRDEDYCVCRPDDLIGKYYLSLFVLMSYY